MEHLPIHLPKEAKLAGPVQFCSMYPIERYLCTLKNYVRTRSHPEGSIAKGKLAEECMTFCSMYWSDVESKLNRPNRNNEGTENGSTQDGRPLGKEEIFLLNGIKWIQAHRYVLNNLSIVDNLKREHLRVLQRKNRRMSSYDMQKLQTESFHDWFKSHSYRSASVPKFGQWDENDLRSGEGFTVIFNKVKEEKHIATAKFPPVPLHTTNNYQTSKEKKTRKKCCCLF